jgi:hypothetical protein
MFYWSSRISRRIKLRSWGKLQVEHWLMMVVVVSTLALCCRRVSPLTHPLQATFTVDMFCLNEVAKNGSNYLSPEEAANLTPEGVAMAIYGSKMALVNEMCALSTIWLVKICLLILYHRLTSVSHPTSP